ncbi:MAG: hypothetical protein AAGH41_03750 [Pseudomonadota bacterium]
MQLLDSLAAGGLFDDHDEAIDLDDFECVTGAQGSFAPCMPSLAIDDDPALDAIPSLGIVEIRSLNDLSEVAFGTCLLHARTRLAQNARLQM